MAIKPETLRRCLLLWTLALAFYQFSENTADPDLWAHTLFGEQFLRSGVVQKTEVFSWTAHGQPFINHEVLAEAALGAAHWVAGGPGILLLKIVVGFATFLLALRLGSEPLEPDWKPAAWIIGALAVVEISFGFAARPQIFTALGLALELWLLRRVFDGRTRWAWALPPLFLVWINTHGGALAGLALVFIAAAAGTAQRKTPLALWIAAFVSVAALLANPWGLELPKSIVEADLWNRSAIQEWRATPLGWDHAAAFILIAITALSFYLTQKPRAWWELAVCAMLAAMALRTVRHTPLFCIAALAFVPPHAASALRRYRHLCPPIELFRGPLAAGFLALSGAGMIVAAFTLHKTNPLNMEAPRDIYPLGAVRFIRDHDLRGNALMFFDWGELCLWELPNVAVSMDGRMDTCYSHELIDEHWKFYSGEPVNPKILDIDKADLALLPSEVAGTPALAARKGWTLVYVDALATVLVRDPARFPKLPRALPERGSAAATAGRAPFPNKPSLRVL